MLFAEEERRLKGCDAMRELFGAKIKPACGLCEQAYPAADGSESVRLCLKKGLVKAGYSCRAFRYDPLMRIPRKPLALEEYKAEDFAL